MEKFRIKKLEEPTTDPETSHPSPSTILPPPPPSPSEESAATPEPIGLSPEQERAFQLFKMGQNIFLTGPGGTGKSHLIRQFVNYANKMDKNIQVCAMTGCATLLLNCNGAKTIHSWSGIKLARGEPDQVIASVMKNRRAVNNWKSANILIIDEISMMSHKIFDILEKCGRYTRNSGKAFGGIQVVFCGDFFQLGPIAERDIAESGEFCFESPKWLSVFPLANHVQLRKNFRQSDTTYIDILSQIRKGELSSEGFETLSKYLKREYRPEEHNNCTLPKLFPTKARVELVNNMMFAKLDTEEHKYPLIKKTNCKLYLERDEPIEPHILQRCEALSMSEVERELNNLVSNGQINVDFKLKVGAAVMCTVNLDMEKGICNGSQGVVTELVGENKVPRVRFSNGVELLFAQHYWQSEEYPTLVIGQYPLCLSWALTIHKIQGATLEMAQMDIGQSIFEYGQTYVALSRIKTLDGLYLENFNPHRIKAHPKVLAFYQKIDDYEESIKDAAADNT